MTTLSDREHGMEAHYALVELGAFLDQSRQRKSFGLRLAAHIGMAGADAEAFAVGLVRRYAPEPGDKRMYWQLSVELKALGVGLSPKDLQNLELADFGQQPKTRTASPPRQPWSEFVMSELLSLFGASNCQSDILVPITPPAHR